MFLGFVLEEGGKEFEEEEKMGLVFLELKKIFRIDVFVFDMEFVRVLKFLN